MLTYKNRRKTPELTANSQFGTFSKRRALKTAAVNERACRRSVKFRVISRCQDGNRANMDEFS